MAGRRELEEDAVTGVHEVVTEHLDADVAVVGYGPVGRLLALLLGRRGKRVVVIERQPEVYPLPRAVHFDDEIGRIFQSVGVAPDSVPEVVAPYDDFYEWARGRPGAAAAPGLARTRAVGLARQPLLLPARSRSHPRQAGPEPGLGHRAARVLRGHPRRAGRLDHRRAAVPHRRAPHRDRPLHRRRRWRQQPRAVLDRVHGDRSGLLPRMAGHRPAHDGLSGGLRLLPARLAALRPQPPDHPRARRARAAPLRVHASAH